MGISPFADHFGRSLSDLRVSVTDRCNFRCRYCMPRESFEGREFLAKTQLLTFEEVARVARSAAAGGVRKIRLTGGEPLLRRDLPVLVQQLSGILQADTGAPIDLALTTNGVLLPRLAPALKEAGLGRLTVSLDAISEDVFQRVCDAPSFSASDVLRGVDAAVQAGFRGIKVNAVIRRGVNEDQVLALARHFQGTGHVLRFIEYMDVGAVNGWNPADVVSEAELLGMLAPLGAVEELPSLHVGEVARRYRFLDGSLEFGIISSISRPFCGDCCRARLSADGHLYTCLFASAGHDLRPVLRSGASDGDVATHLGALWSRRTDRYSEERAQLMRETAEAPGRTGSVSGQRRQLPVLSKVEMSYIGG